MTRFRLTDQMDEWDLAARMMSRIGLCLGFIFVVTSLANAFPVQLLNPEWQMRVIGTLVSNGTMALLALLLIWLAPLLVPRNMRLRLRRDRIAHLALVASLGYLMLIPVEVSTFFGTVNGIHAAQARQVRMMIRRADSIRSLVKQARSTLELRAQLDAMPGPAAPPFNLQTPIAELRPQLLEQLSSAEGMMRQQLRDYPAERLWLMGQESLKVIISTLALALAFASGARWNPASLTLADSWLAGIRGFRVPKLSRSLRSGPANQDYIEAISDLSTAASTVQHRSGHQDL